MPYLEHDPTDMNTFKAQLLKSKRILALCGAGLSASSGLATFRGAGGLWKTHDAVSLATPEAFEGNPSLVWQFYSARRHAAFSAKPNDAHRALAALSRHNKDFITVTQNVDGLSPRAGHPAAQLFPVHGSLSTVKCTGLCTYTELNNFEMALTPALAPVSTSALSAEGDDVQPKVIEIKDLPQCPKCGSGLLRPGVVWFGESLPNDLLENIDEWMDKGQVDLCLVIGTSARVWPAAGYIQECKQRGAKVAIINMEIDDDPYLGGLSEADWLFKGDCAEILPEILSPVIGNMDDVEDLLGADNDKFPTMTSRGGPIIEQASTSGEPQGTGYY